MKLPHIKGNPRRVTGRFSKVLRGSLRTLLCENSCHASTVRTQLDGQNMRPLQFSRPARQREEKVLNCDSSTDNESGK